MEARAQGEGQCSQYGRRRRGGHAEVGEPGCFRLLSRNKSCKDEDRDVAAEEAGGEVVTQGSVVIIVPTAS